MNFYGKLHELREETGKVGKYHRETENAQLHFVFSIRENRNSIKSLYTYTVYMHRFRILILPCM